jgi:hypothetical protein
MDEQTLLEAQERARAAKETYARLQAEYEKLLAQYNQKLVESSHRLPDSTRHRLAAHLCLIERLFSVCAVGTVTFYNSAVTESYEILMNTSVFENAGSHYLRADIVFQSDDERILSYLQYAIEQKNDDELCKICWIQDKTQGKLLRFHYEAASL